MRKVSALRGLDHEPGMMYLIHLLYIIYLIHLIYIIDLTYLSFLIYHLFRLSEVCNIVAQTTSLRSSY